MNKRIIETTLAVLSPDGETASTDPIDLNGAEKFSVQVVALDGDLVAHLEGSNDQINWTEIDNVSIASGASDMFEQPDVDYRWARMSIENNDVADLNANCLVLVIGDGE